MYKIYEWVMPRLMQIRFKMKFISNEFAFIINKIVIMLYVRLYKILINMKINSLTDYNWNVITMTL